MLASTLAQIHPAIPYLKSLFIDEDHIIFQMIHSTNKQVKVVPGMSREQATRPETIARLEELQGEGFNVYVSMNPFPAGTIARQEKFIEEIRNVFIDADADGEKSLQLIRADVAAGLIPTPLSILKTSPNKYHIAWQVDDGFTPDEPRALNRALASRFGGDPAATDLIRILRMPGFKNLKTKYADKPVCELIEKSDLDPYGREEFKIETAATTKSESTTSGASGVPSVKIKQAGTVITTKLAILMNGTIKSQTPFVIEDARGASLEFPSQSEADLSLATCLALEHGDDAALIASEFGKSPLAVRDKWKRDDYRNGTISRAIKSAAKDHCGS
jgi:hypothetical protein